MTTHLSRHPGLQQQLRHFWEMGKVPNLLFHGPPRSGKKTLVREFLELVYAADRDQMRRLVLVANCAHGGKGIKFIRDDVKFFAKTHVACQAQFKTIVLVNADRLTIDAQSALRRCIELFSHSTRFFLVATNPSSLMKPILSRFCEISVPALPLVTAESLPESEDRELRRLLGKLSRLTDVAELVAGCEDLHERAYSALDVLRMVEDDRLPGIPLAKKHEVLLCFDSLRQEVRSEPLLLCCLLHMLFHAEAISLPRMLEAFCF